MGNLVVPDGEFMSMALQYKTIGVRAESYINEYMNIMNSIVREKTIQGETANGIAKYNVKVTQLKGQINDIMKTLQRQLDVFVKEIDKMDRHIY